MAETARNHIFFKRNQSSDNRSHGFGAKFLLKKLSASDFSYERKSAFMWLSSHPSHYSLCFDSKLVVVVVEIGFMETRL